MAYIGDSVRDEILSRVRIEEVIGEYVHLKRRGRNYWGLCPFHTEKTPSFSVNGEKGFFKCFGCGKGGNAITFLREIEHMSYVEALRRLGARVGVEVEQKEESAATRAARTYREQLMEIVAWAADYYHSCLMDSSGGVGLSYLGERGIRDETIKQFRLGYAPPGQSRLSDAGLAAGYRLEDLVAAGVTLRREGDEEHYYDRFRDRVLFPIFTLGGRVQGFGGRALKSGERIAKYLNSPESEIYHKGDLLFGLSLARSSIVRRGVGVLVEGYMDVLSLYQRGVDNAVATCGTSLTEAQALLLKRFCGEVVILYDGDGAGIAAAGRALDILLGAGIHAYVVLLPEGVDPDDFCRSHSAEAVAAYLAEERLDAVAFRTRGLSGGAVLSAVQKSELVWTALRSLSVIEDPIMRAAYVQSLSGAVGIDYRTLSEQLYRLRQSARPKGGGVGERGVREGPGLGLSPTSSASATAPWNRMPEYRGVDQELPMEPYERSLIRFLISYGTEPLYTEAEWARRTDAAAAGETDLPPEEDHYVYSFIRSELERDDLRFSHPVFQYIVEEFFRALEGAGMPTLEWFIGHGNEEVSSAVVDIVTRPYSLSRRWFSGYSSLPDEGAGDRYVSPPNFGRSEGLSVDAEAASGGALSSGGEGGGDGADLVDLPADFLGEGPGTGGAAEAGDEDPFGDLPLPAEWLAEAGAKDEKRGGEGQAALATQPVARAEDWGAWGEDDAGAGEAQGAEQDDEGEVEKEAVPEGFPMSRRDLRFELERAMQLYKQRTLNRMRYELEVELGDAALSEEEREAILERIVELDRLRLAFSEVMGSSIL